MEAVPRLPMLAFELKHSPEYVDFGPTLKKFIREHYGEDPAAYNKNFSDLDQLRQNAIHVTRDFVGCATLKKYYAQLHLISGRFPMGEGGEAAVTFTWEDNQTGRDHIMADIKFEQACVLYNIGALHSNLGAIDTRHNAEGMKVSCTHFQCAAWAFEHLRDHFGSSSMSTDMAHEYLTFHVSVMLAQAQECILEKSMIDSRKNTITAKVSAQVVEFYRTSVKNLDQCNDQQIINSRSYKDWKKRIELKISFYQCITHYYMGRQSEEQQKWGERLAYFNGAQDQLNEAVKLAKNEVPELQEALRFAQDVVGGKLQSAQKDNDFIYHEKIPALDSLPEVKGAPLVKGIPFDPMDHEICGPDIFQKLVPMEAHEASSVYSEEKAKLLRAVMENIDTSNVELEQFMSSLQIDPSMFDPMPDRLPQELLEKCAAMSVRTDAIQQLIGGMSGVSGVATEAEMSMKEIQDMLDEDAMKTRDFEKQYGKKMPSSVLPGLAEECEGHVEKHKQGSQLNSSLHTAMNAHITNLKMLALPPDQLMAQLPPAQPQRSGEDEEVMTEMRRLLGKVEEMKVQRGTLEKQFRDNVHKDDITTVLMGVDSTKDSIYKDQLKKHDTLIGYIGQNLNAQENILRALTDANARFATIRQSMGQQSSQREAMIKDLILSFEKYEELLAKSKKGQDYYSKLNEAVTKTLNRCRSECKVRQEERDMIASKYAPKVPPPSRPTAPKPGQPGTPTTPTLPSASTPTTFTPGPVTPDLSQQPPAGPQGLGALPAFEGPKLKDFLPFMKPQSFGPKAGSPSPQPLPPGSPVSGPPSLPSSASDSPQHRLPPSDTLPGSSTTPDVAAAGQMPHAAARANRPDVYPPPPSHHPPPDVTANLPVNPHNLPSPLANLPDISAQSGAPSLPPHLAGANEMGRYNRAMVAPGGGGISAAGSDAVSLSSSESLASSGAFQQGQMMRHPGVWTPAGLPHNTAAISQASTHPPAADMQQFQAGMTSGQTVSGSVQYPGATTVQYGGQPMMRPSPTPSPASSSSSSPAPSPAMGGYPPQGVYSQGAATHPHSSLPPHLSHGGSSQQGQTSQQFPQHQQGQASQQFPQQPQPGQSSQQFPQQPQPGQSSQQFPQQPQQGQSSQQFPQQHPQGQASQAFPQQHQQQQAYQFYPGGAASQGQQLPAGAHVYQGHPQQQQSGVGASQGGPPQGGLGQAGPGAPQVYVQPGQTSVRQQLPQLPPSSAALGQQPQFSMPPSSAPASFSGVQAGQVPAGHQHPVASGHPQAIMTSTPGGGFSGGQHPPGSQPHASQYQPPTQQPPSSMPGSVAHYPPAQFPTSAAHSTQLSSIPPHPTLPQQSFQPQGHPQLNQNSSHNSQGQAPAQVPPTGANAGPGMGQYATGAQSMFPGAAPQQSTIQPQQQGLPRMAHPSQAFRPQPSPSPPQPQYRPAMPSTHYQAGGYSHSFAPQSGASGVLPQQTSGVISQTSNVIPPASAIPAAANNPGMAGPAHSFPQAQAGQSVVATASGGQVLTGQHSFPPGPNQQFAAATQQQLSSQHKQPQFQQQPYGYSQPQISQQPSSLQPQEPPQPQQSFPQQPATSLQQQQQQLHPQQQYFPHHQQYAQFPQQKQMPQQQQQFHAQQHQPHPQQPYPGSHSQPPMQAAQMRAQVPPPPHQQQIRPQPHPQYSQYPATQQPQTQQLPPESQLIFPTPLQPSIVQPSQPATSQQQPGTGLVSGPHSLAIQGSDPCSSTQPAHSSLPPTTPQPTTTTTSVNPPTPTSSSAPLLTRQESSLDELLSSSPEGSKAASIPAPIITPKVLTDQEKQQQKEEALKKGAIVETVKDPYANSSVLNKLVSDVEAFGKFVDDLSISILGVSRLDTVWKSLIDSQDHDVKKQSIAIARCYPMKNREPDIMPYDDTRVVLSTTKDDYINASWINDLAPSCPKFVASQAPLNVTMTDFWSMVYELGSEVIVQITSEYETGKRFPVYYPTEKGQQMEQGPMIVNLQSVKYRQLWTERNVYLKHSQTKQGRTVIHLQFKAWPVSGFPEEVQHIVRFISEVHSFYQQQRSLLKPVIVHCGNGVGRTGAFLLTYTGMQEMLHGNGMIDVPALAKRMLQKRKNLIHKKEQLKFCYDALLCFAEDFLKKRNILVQHPHFEKKAKISQPVSTTTSSDDIVLGEVNLSTLQQTVGRLHVHGDSADKTSATPPSSSDHSTPPPTTTTPQPANQPKDSNTMSSLPDLVQQQSRNETGGGGSGSASSLPSYPPPAQAGGGGGSASDGRAEASRSGHSRSGSNASQQSLVSLTESGGGASLRASPQHHPPSSFSHSPSPSGSVGGEGGSVSQSLADLQDPSKFTLGKGEQKKRVTKDSFHSAGTGAGLEARQDPADPLSSLDPLWTIHKPPESAEK